VTIRLISSGMVMDRENHRRAALILLQRHSTYDVDELATAAKRFFDTRGGSTVAGVHHL